MPVHMNYPVHSMTSQGNSRLTSPIANDINNLDYHGSTVGSRMGSRIGKGRLVTFKFTGCLNSSDSGFFWQND